MTATLKLYCDTGGSSGSPGSSTDVSSLGPPNLRFKVADDTNIDTNNPIPIPDSGTNYSYWKHVYLKCTVAPDTQIDNVKLYTNGTNPWTGVDLKVGDECPTKNSSSSSGYDPATSAEVMTNHANITSSTSVFSYTSSSAKSISISESNNKITAVNHTTNYVVLQMEVSSTATSGNLSDATLTFQYDEI